MQIFLFASTYTQMHIHGILLDIFFLYHRNCYGCITMLLFMYLHTIKFAFVNLLNYPLVTGIPGFLLP